MFADSHAHIDFPDFEGDLDEVIESAYSAGVRTIIIPSIDGETIAKSARIAETNPHIWFAGGWHPNDADSFDEGFLQRYLGHPKCIAVGEIGLDFYRDYVPKDVQIDVFRRQLEISREAGLPAIVHIRDAWDDAREILDDFPDVPCDFHAFSGGMAELDWAVARGGFIGLGGPVTFKNFRKRDVVEALPLDNLLLETDCPFLAPQSHRGKRNEPSFIPLIAEKIAELKGIDIAEVERATTANLRRFLEIPMPITVSATDSPKRCLSQNFLIDDNIVRKIAKNAGKGKLCVEIGAGNGEITGELSKNFDKIYAIEPDWVRHSAITEKTPSAVVIPKMAQDVDITGLCAFEGVKATVAGNLPYADSSQILFHILDHRTVVDRAIFMIQKELADRICSSTRVKTYGIPSVLFALYFIIKREFDVSRNCFKPAPKVDSTVISLTPRSQSIAPSCPKNYKLLQKVVKASFAHRRKTIANSMRQAFSDVDLSSVFERAGIDASLRAEQIPPEGFVALANAVEEVL